METVNDLTPDEMLKQVLSPDSGIDPHDKVKRLAALLGWTMKDLAERLGVHEGHLSQVLSGKRPYEGTRRRIAEALNVAPEIIWPELADAA